MSKINCNVLNCKYNNNSTHSCDLSNIVVGSINNSTSCDRKEDTQCSSFEEA